MSVWDFAQLAKEHNITWVADDHLDADLEALSMWVGDAISLIYLAKVDRLTLPEHLEPSRVLPERVYEGVVGVGPEDGYPGARRIERLVDADRSEAVSVTTTPLTSPVPTPTMALP